MEEGDYGNRIGCGTPDPDRRDTVRAKHPPGWSACFRGVVGGCLYHWGKSSKLGIPDEGRDEAERMLGENPEAKIVLSLPQNARDRSDGIWSTPKRR